MYVLKVGEMYLSDLYVTDEAASNEFIKGLGFHYKSKYVFSNFVDANAVRNKLYIVLGLDTKVVNLEDETHEAEF